MQEQLELIARTDFKPSCNFSRSPLADTWFVNLRITESQKLPFVYCEECPRQRCYRFTSGNLILAPD
jgi:hypothetical protein